MSNTETVIQVENIVKVYPLYDKPVDRLKESLHPLRKKYHKDFFALNGVSFDVYKGETLGIIGKNGSGKSTILKIITGILQPTSGSAVSNGRISALLELGTGFNLEMTGMENIFFAGMLNGFTRAEMNKKLPEILKFADIGEFVYQPVKTYSTGMFARLAFAVAINVSPDILIVDEALSVGDLSFQSKCFAKFNEFRKTGKTILFVTHSLDTVIRYCDRAILLDKGQKISEGKPKEVVDDYKQILTNTFNQPGMELREKILDSELNTEKSSTLSSDKPAVSDNVMNVENSVNLKETDSFKSDFEINKEMRIYGTGNAEIIDFGIFDKEGEPCQKFIHGENFSVKMKIKFNKPVENPIFAFTIKDIKGLEITGTNTYYEHIKTGSFSTGDIVLAVFSQKMRLQSGAYALSLGCTNYTFDDFVVYSRLYDCILFEVISDRHMVGFFNPETKIEIEKIT